MGREFVDLFNRWAETYDSTVAGMDEEYKDVFENYGQILQEVARRVNGHVIEFGTGTGNLTEFLAAKAETVMGVEPSDKMREAANRKLKETEVVEGDFLVFPEPEHPVDAIVSSYAFHHLTDEEKGKAAAIYADILKTGGKVVFADTMFMNEDRKQEIIQDAQRRQFFNLAEDLQTEYYTTLPVMASIFEDAGFEVSFTSMNKFVWILEAVKRENH
ncbi:class I SAM-dependent methyltransferase [Evansella sp. LMS18]|jgi:putative AdoMet-dependent methyltransferase|uniref:class I SAM-dependent DNA methyltransferase n=1 Tax=Evansella sp. LMS18 TaxID=2924033 RepID=UPI0020D15E1C|nr:class I SAM-dependent methyltransferase [Evansella sp. LMS18]UTR11043.1 class I SAM-dependent methyltransferase [Evansella sp. LMS18]